MSDGECVKVRPGEVLFADDGTPVELVPLPAWPFAAMRDLGRQLNDAKAKLNAVLALITHAKLVSPTDRMTVMVGDLEHALGLRDRSARSKNDDSTEAWA